MNLIKTITHSGYDIFKDGQNSDLFIGRPFYLDFNIAKILVADSWKHKVKGIPEGCFLLAFYDNPYDEEINETFLLRVLKPTSLPTDSIVVSSLIEYYKDNLNTSGKNSELDDFTRYEFSFSGLECRVLGTFYTNKENIEFGADVENFYSANNYKVYKATDKILASIVNQRDSDISFGGENEFSIGKVRYSSSKRFFLEDNSISSVEVYINPNDMLGKRTALFGMTRTGKSNTVKKIIEATSEISDSAIKSSLPNTPLSSFEPIDKNTGKPIYKVGQLIFDINGEYANANLQDDGTAIFDMYKENTTRYSTIEKDGFKVMKVNFYNDIVAGFDLIKNSLVEDKSDYIKSLCSVDFDEPENYRIDMGSKTSDERKATIEYDKKVALYKCCLFKAGFKVPTNRNNVKFNGHVSTINTLCPNIEPHKSISLEQASTWFETIFDAMEDRTEFNNYRNEKDREYFDEDMMALLKFFTRKNRPGSSPTVSGYRKIRSLSLLHTDLSDDSFESDIIKALRHGNIVIVDLSQGQPSIQRLYSEKICNGIFKDSMKRFIDSKANNFIQFYFEEAHNLFPQKEDKDLSQVYNRIAKEGAKLNIGMIYATQEVSSISSNILKNTQNWFIAHLNNEDETKELKKFYDFSDFTSSLIKFSAKNDQGFVRMKTYSNPFIVPVQIDRFSAK